MSVSLELVRRAPCPALAGLVWNLAGYAERGTAAERQELPVAGAVIVVNLGPRLEVGRAGATPRTPRPFGSFAAGVHDVPAITRHAGHQTGVQVYLSPPGARALLGVPMHELANQTVELDAILGRRADRLEERVATASTWERRLEILEEALLDGIARGPSPPPDAVRAWDRLRTTEGRIAIADLAGELGCSRRHLAAQFQDAVGLPPKTLARILRFRGVIDRLPPAGPIEWGRVAADRGYADQSHLIREFRALAGMTPEAYRRSRLPGTDAADPIRPSPPARLRARMPA